MWISVSTLYRDGGKRSKTAVVILANPRWGVYIAGIAVVFFQLGEFGDLKENA